MYVTPYYLVIQAEQTRLMHLTVKVGKGEEISYWIGFGTLKGTPWRADSRQLSG